ncbi:hypothetical protein BJV78DRAFT_1243463 [Lactifluus subvellereus]|nr:hypothetical protein BJV78DRAFT_1243463 [Lactifluus subvellereus]
MPQAAGMHAKLVKADFHGSIMIGQFIVPASSDGGFLQPNQFWWNTNSLRRSRNAALVGASGIVVQETENTFKVVTRKNRLKVLPKRGSVFTFAVPLYSTEPSAATGGSVANSGTNGGGSSSSSSDARHAEMVLDGPHIEFELYGNQFCFHAVDRAGRKFKHKETIELVGMYVLMRDAHDEMDKHTVHILSSGRLALCDVPHLPSPRRRRRFYSSSTSIVL